MSIVERLQNWFIEQCNGSWEHEFGLKIETIDNPGWKIIVPLAHTRLYNKNFKTIELERSEFDWIYCEKKDTNFYGYGGTKNLSEVIEIFLDFTKK